MATKAKGAFRPKIVAFACNWCSPDLSEFLESKRQFPADIYLIRVMCGGRVDPGFVLKAFELGADGVFLSTCGLEDCHYSFGSKLAQDHFEKVQKLVHVLGLGKDRLRLKHLSASAPGTLTTAIEEFVEVIQKIGRNSLIEESPKSREAT